jgi:hypothetical protein
MAFTKSFPREHSGAASQRCVIRIACARNDRKVSSPENRQIYIPERTLACSNPVGCGSQQGGIHHWGGACPSATPNNQPVRGRGDTSDTCGRSQLAHDSIPQVRSVPDALPEQQGVQPNPSTQFRPNTGRLSRAKPNAA